MPSLPVRLPEYQNELTPTEDAHYRASFPVCEADFTDLCSSGPLRLSYLERRVNYYELSWVRCFGPPDRNTSFQYQAYLEWSCKLPFRRISRLLERVEFVLVMGEEVGRAVDTRYQPMAERGPLTWSAVVR